MGNIMEVYVDDIMIKSTMDKDHLSIWKEYFARVEQI